MTVEGRVVVVTGASSGLGAHTARLLARRGAHVVAVARRADRLEAELSGVPGELVPVVADVGSTSGALAIASAAMDAFGRVDALVNNAGSEVQGTIDMLDPEHLLAMFRTNVFGIANCVRALLPALRVRGGSVVNIGSTVVSRPPPGRFGYVASKGAVEAMSRALAVDLGPQGIRVNVVRPGLVPSGLRGSTEADEAAAFGSGEHALQALALTGTGDDVAGAVAYLISDSARWVTGTTIDVDGGYALGVSAS